MKRLTLTIIATSIVAGASFAAPAYANSKLENAVLAAVEQGKETKKVKTYNGHEFNIKPVKATRIGGGGGFTVSGQLSHHLTWRSDDQYHYTIQIDRAGTILKFDEKIDRGGLTSMLLKLPVGELVENYSGKNVPAPIAEKGIEEAGRWLGSKLDGKWEGAARKVVIQIGMQVAKSYSLTPKAAAAAEAKSGKVVMKSKVGSTSGRVGTKRMNVRDHRTD
jgi:hypothetical protein